MTTKIKIVAGVAGVAVVGAGGFLIGKNTAPALESNAQTPSLVRSDRSPAKSFRSSAVQTNRNNRVQSAKEAMVLPGGSNRLRALMDYYAELDPSQFKEEAKKLQDVPWGERAVLDHILFSRWGEVDPIAAMAHTKTMGYDGAAVRGTLMQSWTARSPQDAAAYFANNPTEFNVGRTEILPGSKKSTASIIAAELLRQDPAGAMKWAESLGKHHMGEAVQGIIMGTAIENPAEAAAMISSIADADTQKMAEKSLFSDWGKKNWDEAQTWIATLPADNQANALGLALRGLAGADPKAAAGKLTSIPEGAERDETASKIASKWSREDAVGAAEWLMESGSIEAQKSGVGSVVGSWVRQDVRAAYEFVNAQPKGELRDKASSAYIMYNRGGDAEQNFKLAVTIDSEDDRSSVIPMAAAMWARKDKEAALNFVNSTSNLSEKERELILQSHNRGRTMR